MKAFDSLNKTYIAVWLRIPIVLVCLLIVIYLLMALSILMIDVFNMNNILDGYDATRNLLIQTLVLFIGTTATVFTIRRTVDRESISSLGISFAGQHSWALMALAGAAVILGIGTILLTVFNAIDLEWNEFDPMGQIGLLAIFFFIGCYEELLFRGYILGNLLTVANRNVALLVSSVLFALFHLANEGITMLSTINLVLAGILLGLPYVFTKNLWFPILFHTFWNYLQGGILGFKVSGLSLNSLLYVTPNKPTLLSGGDFGFEGSLVCTILLIGTIAFLVYMHLPEEIKANETR